jgi:acetyl/propionyl-CoA carboxylase alpha subunit
MLEAATGGGRAIGVLRDDADPQDKFLPTMRQAVALFLDSRVYLTRRISAAGRWRGSSRPTNTPTRAPG